jgi:uncharacterized protein (DUF2267 family)
MQFHEFIGQVQSKARLPSQADAIAATRATLETLGERVLAGQAESLAAQLPEEIGIYLVHQADVQNSFDIDTFWQKVSQREDEDLPEAVYHSRAVVAVLQEAVSAGEIENLREALPDNFDPLFESGSEGHLE